MQYNTYSSNQFPSTRTPPPFGGVYGQMGHGHQTPAAKQIQQQQQRQKYYDIELAQQQQQQQQHSSNIQRQRLMNNSHGTPVPQAGPHHHQPQAQQHDAHVQSQNYERMMMMPDDGEEKMTDLVYAMYNIEKREAALLELSKRREQYENLALVLWNSFGSMAILLTEIIDVYPLLSPPSLTASASNRVCNALALLQCVASHPLTRTGFLGGRHSYS